MNHIEKRRRMSVAVKSLNELGVSRKAIAAARRKSMFCVNTWAQGRSGGETGDLEALEGWARELSRKMGGRIVPPQTAPRKPKVFSVPNMGRSLKKIHAVLSVSHGTGVQQIREAVNEIEEMLSSLTGGA